MDFFSSYGLDGSSTDNGAFSSLGDLAASSGNDPTSGTSAFNTGTTSGSGGGMDYLDTLIHTVGALGSQAITAIGPSVQGTLTQSRPTAVPGSAVAGGVGSAFGGGSSGNIIFIALVALIGYKLLFPHEA